MKGSDRRHVSSHLWLTVHLQCICSGCPMVSAVLRICGAIRAFFVRFVLNVCEHKTDAFWALIFPEERQCCARFGVC